jgi:hypothetical protein
VKDLHLSVDASPRGRTVCSSREVTSREKEKKMEMANAQEKKTTLALGGTGKTTASSAPGASEPRTSPTTRGRPLSPAFGTGLVRSACFAAVRFEMTLYADL